MCAFEYFFCFGCERQPCFSFSDKAARQDPSQQLEACSDTPGENAAFQGDIVGTKVTFSTKKKRVKKKVTAGTFDFAHKHVKEYSFYLMD